MSDKPVSSFMLLLKETSKSLKDKQIVGAFDDFRHNRLDPLWHQENNAGVSPYVLSLVGLTNVGKSTIAEALLGFPVAPRKNGPATAIPVEYIHAPYWRMEILYRHSCGKEETEFENASLLATELERRVVGVDAATASSIAWVTVRGPMMVLKDGLTLADTPGFGAAQKGDDDGTHQQRLEEFITKRVHRVYFCLAAGDNLTVSDAEVKFYQKIKHLCNHIIVNKWKFGGDIDKQQKYKNLHQRLFPEAKFVFVNAKMAIVGKQSNIESLQSVIESHATPERRRCMVWMDLLGAWKDFHYYMETVHRLSEIPWREVSKNSFLLSCETIDELQPIVSDIERIKK